MSDFEVVLPRTTEEWQRDMNFAYEKSRADAIAEHKKEMHDMIDELYKRADECQDKMDNMYYDGKEDGLREAIEIIKSKLC